MIKKNRSTFLRIVKVFDPHEKKASYFIEELHPKPKLTNGEKQSICTTIDLADPETLPGAAPIDVYRALIGLNDATGGGIEQLLMVFSKQVWMLRSSFLRRALRQFEK